MSKRMCWYYKGNRDDDRLYVEYQGEFVPYDELPVDMVESDGKINVALNSFVHLIRVVYLV